MNEDDGFEVDGFKRECEPYEVDVTCEHCKSKLYFDNRGMFCKNSECIVYDKYILEKK